MKKLKLWIINWLQKGCRHSTQRSWTTPSVTWQISGMTNSSLHTKTMWCKTCGAIKISCFSPESKEWVTAGWELPDFGEIAE